MPLLAANKSRQVVFLKILIILLIVVMSIGTFFIANSYASSHIAPTYHPSLSVVLQIEIRNSDGVLVAYIEPSIFYLRNINLIHDYLDQKDEKNKTILTIDENTYEVIEWSHKSKIRESWEQQSGYQLGYKGYGILNARLNGSISQEGDIVTAYWKITRPV